MGLQYLEDEHKKGTLTAEELSGVVVDLKFSCGQSLEILNQLLTYDKIDSGLMKLDKSKFAVRPFIEEAVRQFSLQV
jgi:signal transduction histidine kinase